jgi:phage gpG-like protein
MKTVKTEATGNKTASIIDLSDELDGLTKAQKRELVDQIGELLVEQVLSYVADVSTPVSGAGFKKTLSPEYKKRKIDEVGSGEPNLDLTGEMLNSLTYKVQGEKIELGVFGEDAPKADGHNNFSGKSSLPQRRFLPGEGQEFKSDIKRLVKETVESYKADNVRVTKEDLKDIESKKDLYDYLKDQIGDLPRKRLAELVLQSELAAELDDADLLDLL